MNPLPPSEVTLLPHSAYILGYISIFEDNSSKTKSLILPLLKITV